MRYSPLLIALLLCSTVKADCGVQWLQVWPDTQVVLKQNPVFVLTGYAFTAKKLELLDSGATAQLISSEEAVPLKVESHLEGEFQLEQWLLSPVRPLKPGATYRLCITNIMHDDVEYWGNPSWPYQTWEHLGNWQVESGMDTKAPSADVCVKELDKTLIHYGCGPAEYVNFEANINRFEEPVLVRATVKHLKGGSSTTFFLEADADGNFSVGHGMCSGAFMLRDEELHGWFEAMDTSGNLAPLHEGKIEFSGVTEADSKF